MTDFRDIAYLADGNEKQRRAYEVLTANEILEKLKKFDPILVGTVPINIDIENSDLDIICYFTDKMTFWNETVMFFEGEPNFSIREIEVLGSIVATFKIDQFEIEIFGQNIPVTEQKGFRHMIIEYRLLLKYGEELRLKIIDLKTQGLKTEPAFALALGLYGDPYEELLKLETDFITR